MDSALSNLLLINECLFDAKRIKAIERAIKNTIRSGDIVVDAGTGTGILALFSAQAGAKKVYAIEWDSEIAKTAKKNVIACNFQHIIEIINTDVRTFKLPKGQTADVVTMEMLDTGMIAELQADAMIRLKENNVIGKDTILLPEEAHFFISAVDYDFNFYGFNLPLIIQARNNGVIPRIKLLMSKPLRYGVVHMNKIATRNFSKKLEIKITKTGFVNAVKLTTDIILGGKICHPTSDMNMPVIIPIPPQNVKKGDIIKLEIKYIMSKGFESFSIK